VVAVAVAVIREQTGQAQGKVLVEMAVEELAQERPLHLEMV
jgi:hypothetical protein